jgi:hypothetical protein
LRDAFVAKLDPNGSALVYSTYLGGSNDDLGRAITVDAHRDAYVTGATASTNFPARSGVQPVYGGGSSDAFVAKIVDVVLPLPTTSGSGTSRSEEGAASRSTSQQEESVRK